MPPGETRWRLALAAALVAAGLAARYPLAYLLAGGLLVLTPLERLQPRHHQRVLRAGLAADVLHALVSFAVFGLLALVPTILLRPVLPEIPQIANWLSERSILSQAVIGLIVFDLVGYASHRLQHEVRFLWRFHRVHHSSEHLDWLAGARTHPLPGLLDGLFRAVPALLLGLSGAQVGVLSLIVGITAVLTHANISWQLPRLSRWWATPEFHHWHHANEPAAINKNYAGLLPIWDRVFGTFYLPEDRRPQRYGADRRLPDTWWAQLADPLRPRPRR